MRKYIDIITSTLPLTEEVDVSPYDSAQERKERYSGDIKGAHDAKVGDKVKGRRGTYEVLSRDGQSAELKRVSDGKVHTAPSLTFYEKVIAEDIETELPKTERGIADRKLSEWAETLGATIEWANEPDEFYDHIQFIPPTLRTFIKAVREQSPLVEAFDDFKDPALDKETDDSKQPENDFQMFKDKAEVGAPETAKNDETESNDDAQDCEGDDCEEIGKSLNAKDMKAFVGGYKKLCAGAVESISMEEAKELAEIMIALFKSKIEDNPIEESNQDNKLAQEASAAGEPAPVNPNAPKKPLSPADKRAAVAGNDPKMASSGPKPAPSEPAKSNVPNEDDVDAGADEAKELVKKKLGKA